MVSNELARDINMLLAAKLHRSDILQKYLEEMRMNEIEELGNAAHELAAACDCEATARTVHEQGR